MYIRMNHSHIWLWFIDFREMHRFLDPDAQGRITGAARVSRFLRRRRSISLVPADLESADFYEDDCIISYRTNARGVIRSHIAIYGYSLSRSADIAIYGYKQPYSHIWLSSMR